MLLKPEPIFFALQHIKKKHDKSYNILLDPKGKKYHHDKVVELAKESSLTLIVVDKGFDKRVPVL